MITLNDSFASTTHFLVESATSSEAPLNSLPPHPHDPQSTVSNDSKPPGWPSVVSVKDDSSDTAEILGWAIGCTTFSLLIFAFATYQYLRKVWNSPAAKKKKRQAKLKKQFDYDVVTPTEREEKAIAEAQQQGPIAVEEFLKQLKKRKKKNWLDIEFKTVLKLSPHPPCEAAKKAEHKKKNTYPNVLPFDSYRVILESLPNDDCSDFINASYVHSPKKQNAYIAAQGPSRHTINDFWRMIWQENVHCIVMATNLFEHARQQCEKYWHNQHGRYGGVDVWLQDTDILADFVVRTFQILKQGTDSPRIVKQFQFNGWSDHDAPNATAVLEYNRKIHVFAKDKPGPLLVHCSTGAGRTGAFIAIDIALELLQTDKYIDVLKLVLSLRNYRPCLVRTAQQYEFVYDTIAMHLLCGVTVINVRELPTVVQKLSLKDPTTKQTGFEQQLKTLQAIVPKLTVGECAGGHRAENRRKSRDIMMQPPERARPYLMTHDSNESTDYINACYIDGYRHPNAFIVTQWPLKSTINDIWRLVFDYNIPTMVVLNEQTTSRAYPRFWPTERGQHMPYGPLTVEFVEETEAPHVTSRLFKVRKTLVTMQTTNDHSESAKVMRIFHLRTWANNHRMPHNPAALVELLSQVEQWQMNRCHGRTPTLVVSRNGVSRVGTFCTISHCWDKMKEEGEVDVFTAAKAVKMNRPNLIDNLIDYMYCHTFLMMLTEIIKSSPSHALPVSDWSENTTSQPSKPVIGERHDRTGTTTNQLYLAKNEHKPDDMFVSAQLTSPQTSEDYIEDSPEVDERMLLQNNKTNQSSLHNKTPMIFVTEVSDIEFIDASPTLPERDFRENLVISQNNETPTMPTSLSSSMTEKFSHNAYVKARSPEPVTSRVPTPHPREASLETESEDYEKASLIPKSSDTEYEMNTSDLEKVCANAAFSGASRFDTPFSHSLHERVRAVLSQVSQESHTSESTSSDHDTKRAVHSLKPSLRRPKRRPMRQHRSISSGNDSLDLGDFLCRRQEESCYETCSPGSSASSGWQSALSSRRPSPCEMVLPLVDIARPKEPHKPKPKWQLHKREQRETQFKSPRSRLRQYNNQSSSGNYSLPYLHGKALTRSDPKQRIVSKDGPTSPGVKYKSMCSQDSGDSLDNDYITADEGSDYYSDKYDVNRHLCQDMSLTYSEENHSFEDPSVKLLCGTPERGRDGCIDDTASLLLLSPAAMTTLTEPDNEHCHFYAEAQNESFNTRLCATSRDTYDASCDTIVTLLPQIETVYKSRNGDVSQQSVGLDGVQPGQAVTTGSSSPPEQLIERVLVSTPFESHQNDSDVIAVVTESDIEHMLQADLDACVPPSEVTQEDLQQVANILDDLDEALDDYQELTIATLPHQSSEPTYTPRDPDKPGHVPFNAADLHKKPERRLRNTTKRSLSSTSVLTATQTGTSFDSGILSNSTISSRSSPTRCKDTANLNAMDEKHGDNEKGPSTESSESVSHRCATAPRDCTRDKLSSGERLCVADIHSEKENYICARERRAKFRNSSPQSPIDEAPYDDKIVVVALVHGEDTVARQMQSPSSG